MVLANKQKLYPLTVLVGGIVFVNMEAMKLLASDTSFSGPT